MSFLLYICGLVLVLAGVAYGATLLNVPTQWIVVACVVLAGLGVLSAVAQTRLKDKAD
jgi:TctA family transporter